MNGRVVTKQTITFYPPVSDLSGRHSLLCRKWRSLSNQQAAATEQTLQRVYGNVFFTVHQSQLLADVAVIQLPERGQDPGGDNCSVNVGKSLIW